MYRSRFNILLAFLLIVYIGIQISYFLYYSPPNFILPLTWDKLGYYLYLPSAFIYRDILQLGFIPDIMKKYELSGYFYQAHMLPNGNYVMSYTLGLALLELPFFFCGHLGALLFNYPADGFSLPYQFCITLGGTFYAMVGLWYLYHSLRHFFSELVSLLSLLIILFSTNYFYYSAFENAMTHSYLFTLYAATIFYTIRWHQQQKSVYLFYLGLALGLAVVMRPSEIIIVLIPLLWGVFDRKTALAKLDLLRKHLPQLFILVLAIIPAGLLQIAYWKYASGHWLYNSYKETGQHFNFLHPHILQGLFSLRKGWFVYSPVMLLPVAGLFLIARQAKDIAAGIILFTVINVYIVFSWWNWYYGGSFGCRALVQSYALLAFPLAGLIHYSLSTKYLKWLLAGFILLATLLNLFQTMQYTTGMLSTEGLSTYTYPLLFGRTRIELDDIKRFEKLDLIRQPIRRVDTLKRVTFENFPVNVDSSLPGTKALVLSNKEQLIFEGKVNQEQEDYIRIAAHGFFDHIEYNYAHMPAMHLVFLDGDLKVISDKKIKIQPLMNKGKKINFDYLGDPGVWEDFDFSVKKPKACRQIQLFADNIGNNRCLLSYVQVENITCFR